MCGIISAISKKNVTNILIEGMKRLEYRGYDSSGLAIINKKKEIIRLRSQGKIKNIINLIHKTKQLIGNIGIAHTRWATHGLALKKNAHPHVSKNIAIVHNGIIENYLNIKTKLQKNGYIFTSDTDTEVIAHLIHYEQNKNNKSLLKTIQTVILKLTGSYSMVIMDRYHPNILIAIRSGSPLLIGLGKQENFISSDQLSLLKITKKFIYLNEGDIAILSHKKITIFNKNSILVHRPIVISNIQNDSITKGHYQHYMKKEIYEQPYAIKNAIRNRITKNEKIQFSELNNNAHALLLKIEHIDIIACGTSYNAGMVSKYWFESLSKISCNVEIASEFCHRKFIVKKNSLLLILSQSGETADSLTALRNSKKHEYLGSLVICNSSSSSLVYESNFSILTNAGIEIGVASTKSFTTQLTILLMIAAKINNLKTNDEKIENKVAKTLRLLPEITKNVLKCDSLIYSLAKELSDKNNIIFIGRGHNYPIAMEGALKLKEISYTHAEAYAAGELKHGPLALVDSSTQIIVIAPNDNLIDKIKLNISEIRTRGGVLHIFSDNLTKFNDNTNVIRLPYDGILLSPIIYVIPLQLLAYYVALIKGKNIDKPRNLAKSVTVE
ncbi:glucosamine-fructose-6-phosphate aminotransferase isomerizing [Buchnera aphidicola str. Bp (Baizongia pistaciae)]|uniref:Glutamine--fructose-6-phosphate aminotransferase [isomerizing] n=1 Tax=Buchnera aphidicola subsp. Baizongia pistaciae (strain Bp) TaxID=224915 RepID=GLMS_BUCBP|nr:glutamine--fructose-6-phosphate transaminase (isomerizing) [Buchnera aphidicola]P59499.2 RecName: Full=Glutamine--fructose-6-phosphate aminotransferase [isomerizing]; AltName: Full=D-fructose-6-phosphate amidotransferase; AltName: Full=GFAT; AltName: Full=Glucosamine-6-phosphate synthase; AltName: Full=Hexosephosphate aminotransferase; AltName: Full=L-glutamine--D-fructose-6-phosphate amidotransferase [Buchnera aphidicola str. Bp (Baizongia pistaciae)]AAO26771.1 glucosamine-fructose-6-phosphat